MSTDFLIFYEHVSREVENDSLIKYELNRRGYTCEIMPFDGPQYFSRYLLNRKAKVLVVPWLRTDTNICHYLYLTKNPYKIANLQWEQVTNKASRDCGMDSFSENAVKAFHLCWGKYPQNIILQKGGEKKNLPIVGAIQQDYGRNIFKNYFLQKDEIAKTYSLDISKPWILYVSSFSLVNISQEYLEDLKKRYGDYILKDHVLNVETERLTLEWIERYLKENVCEFIYRPHPTEITSLNINRLMEKYRNFHVISDYSVKQWGKICDKVNIWISTSNAELTSMNIVYNIVRPIRIDYEQEMESMYNEEYITTYEEFCQANNVFDTDSDKKQNKARKQRLQTFYDYDEQRAAYLRVADALEDILLGQESAIFEISKEQRKKSSRIFIRTMFFSLLIGLNNRIPSLFRVLPLKKTWKDIVIDKTKKYLLGKETEKRVLDYISKNEE